MTMPGRQRTRTAVLGWDDGDAAAFSAGLVDVVRAGDLGADEPLARASRSAVLTQFASATRRGSWPAAVTPPRGRPRAAWALGMAALLCLLVVGGVAGSAPGRPLYEARVAAEAIALPDDPLDRERAQVDRLAARVRDTAGAAAAGDAGGVRAGLDEFAQIAVEATTRAVPDQTVASQVAAILARVDAIPAQSPEAAASLVRARVAGAALLEALSGPHAQPDLPNEVGPTVDPAASPSPTMTPRCSGGPAKDGAGLGPSTTAGPHRTSPPRSGTGGGSTGPSRGAGPSPSPTSKASAGSGGGSGAKDGGASGGSGSGSGGSGGGRGGPNP